MDSIGCDTGTRECVCRYAALLENRASGKVKTAAQYIRDFVRNHPTYKHDSVVSPEIAHDLMVAAADIGEGRMEAPELLGDVLIAPVHAEGGYEVTLECGPLDMLQ